MQTRLYRSRQNRVIGGVCGGLAEYFNTDPVAVRLAWLLLILIGGSGLLLYILAWIIMPEAPFSRPAAPVPPESPVPPREEPATTSGYAQVPTQDHPPAREAYDVGRRTKIGGAILIAVGGYFLIDRLVYFDLSAWWPLLLIIAGVALLLSNHRTVTDDVPPRTASPPHRAPASAEPRETSSEVDTPPARDVAEEGEATGDAHDRRDDQPTR